MERKTLLLISAASAAFFAAPTGFAAADASSSPGYWHDSNGELLRSGQGQCVRTGRWSPETAIPECDPKLFERRATAAPAAEPESQPQSQTEPENAPFHQEEMAAMEAPRTETTTLNGNALFGFDQARLTPQDKQKLDDLLAQLKTMPEVTQIRIAGHTDSTGDPAYNRKLSLRRAKAAEKYLTDHGVDENRIVISAMGEDEPVANNATREGRAQNRRAEIEVEGEQNVPSGSSG